MSKDNNNTADKFVVMTMVLQNFGDSETSKFLKSWSIFKAKITRYKIVVFF